MAEDRGLEFAAVVYLFLALTWTASLLRLYVRVRLTKSFGADNWLAVEALVSFPYLITYYKMSNDAHSASLQQTVHWFC